MRTSLALTLCLLGTFAGQGRPEEEPVRSRGGQAVMPRQYITPTVSQLEIGERGWINGKALVVDDKFRCWVVKAAHVHDNPGDAGSYVEIVRTRSGFDVAVHMSYKWKTIPEAGLSSDCYAVETLTFEPMKRQRE